MPEAGEEKRVKNSSWLLWWRINHEECARQAKEYDFIPWFQSARAVAVGCIALSVALTVALIGFQWNSLDAWSLVDVAAFVILAFYIARGHRWAMLAIMVVWTLEKAFGIVEGATSSAPWNVVVQLLWWAAFMHAFWFAFRVERARRKYRKETGTRTGFAGSLSHAFATCVLFLCVCAGFAAGTAAFFYATIDFYRYAAFNGADGALAIRGIESKPFHVRWAALTVVRDNHPVTYVFDDGTWEEFGRLWSTSTKARPGDGWTMHGPVMHNGSTALAFYSNGTVRMALQNHKGCVRYDLAPADYSTVDASIINMRAFFSGTNPGERWGGDPWHIAESTILGLVLSDPAAVPGPAC